MRELIRRCRYCKREMMDVSMESYTENPWCRHCLKERMEAAAAKLPPMRWELRGGYMVPVPIDPPSPSPPPAPTGDPR